MVNQVIKYIKDAIILEKKGYPKQAISILYKALSENNNNASILSEIGRIYLTMLNFEKAEEFLTKSLELEQTNTDTINLIIQLAMLTNREKLAVQMAQKLQEIQNSEDSFYLLFLTFLNSQQYNLIIQYYKLFKLEQYKNFDIDLTVAKAHYALNDFDASLNILKSLQETVKNNDELNLLLSKIYIEKREFLNVINIYQNTNSKNNDFKAYYAYAKLNTGEYFTSIDTLKEICFSKNAKDFYYDFLAQAYALTGWLDEAVQSLKKALKLNPLNIKYNSFLAYIYFKQHKKELANSEADYVLEQDKNNLEASILKILINYDKSTIIQSKTKIDKLLKQHNDIEIIFYAAYKIYYDMNLKTQALVFLESALTFNPASTIYLMEQAELYYELNQFNKAKTILYKLFDINSSAVDVLYLLTKIALIERNVADVEKYISLIENTRFNSAKFDYLKAYSLYLMEDYKKATDYLVQALDIEPENKEYYELMGDILFESGKYKEAYEYYNEITEFSEIYPSLLLKLAKTSLKTNNIEKAEQYYSKIFAHEGIEAKREYVEIMKDLKKLDKVATFLKAQFARIQNETIKQEIQTLINELED